MPPFPWLTAWGPLGQALSAGVVFAGLMWIMHGFLNKALPERDPWLLPLAGLLSGLGLVLLYRLGPDIAQVRRTSGFAGLFGLQARSFALSLLIMIFSVKYFTKERLESLTRKRYIYVVFSVVLITLTAVFGTEIHGKRLAIGLGIMNFRPWNWSRSWPCCSWWDTSGMKWGSWNREKTGWASPGVDI